MLSKRLICLSLIVSVFFVSNHSSGMTSAAWQVAKIASQAAWQVAKITGKFVITHKDQIKMAWQATKTTAIVTAKFVIKHRDKIIAGIIIVHEFFQPKAKSSHPATKNARALVFILYKNVTSQTKKLGQKITAAYTISQKDLNYIWQKTSRNHPYITATAIAFPVLIAVYRKHGDRIKRVINPQAALDKFEEQGNERDAVYFSVLRSKSGKHQ
jgi:hypothetical protein